MERFSKFEDLEIEILKRALKADINISKLIENLGHPEEACKQDRSTTESLLTELEIEILIREAARG